MGAIFVLVVLFLPNGLASLADAGRRRLARVRGAQRMDGMADRPSKGIGRVL
jgi:hypothetical protein